jgi:hypothetical protein
LQYGMNLGQKYMQIEIGKKVCLSPDARIACLDTPING